MAFIYHNTEIVRFNSELSRENARKQKTGIWYHLSLALYWSFLMRFNLFIRFLNKKYLWNSISVFKPLIHGIVDAPDFSVVLDGKTIDLSPTSDCDYERCASGLCSESIVVHLVYKWLSECWSIYPICEVFWWYTNARSFEWFCLTPVIYFFSGAFL